MNVNDIELKLNNDIVWTIWSV